MGAGGEPGCDQALPSPANRAGLVAAAHQHRNTDGDVQAGNDAGADGENYVQRFHGRTVRHHDEAARQPFDVQAMLKDRSWSSRYRPLPRFGPVRSFSPPRWLPCVLPNCQLGNCRSPPVYRLGNLVTAVSRGLGCPLLAWLNGTLMARRSGAAPSPALQRSRLLSTGVDDRR
jgi:hypothetical protein